VVLTTLKVVLFFASSVHITNPYIDEALKENINSSLNASFRGIFMSELATLEEQLVDNEEDAQEIDAKSKDIMNIYEDRSITPAVKNVDILEQLVGLIRAIGLEVPTTDAVALHKQRMIGHTLDQINSTDDMIALNVISLLFAQQTQIEGGIVKMEKYVFTNGTISTYLSIFSN